MHKISIILILLFGLNSISFSQSDSSATAQNGEKIKKGFNFGGVPAVAYDSDLGFLYGVILNVYHYGDGSNYPNYNHSLYMEWSQTTKGSGIKIIEYDARNLTPKLRLKAELSYLTEQALDFYGFNGYNSYFGNEFLDNTDTSNYISRLYYRHDRKMLRTGVNLEGQIIGKKLRWLGGLTYNNVKIGSLDLEKLNNKKEPDELLPDTATLYDKYVAWGIIPQDQKNGGVTTLINAGIVYDSRDIESSPNKGIWSELLIQAAPSFIGNDYAYARLMLTHRQYLTLVKQKLVLAYRVSVQSKIAGEMPFYMLPFYVQSNTIKDGWGGSKTIRGVLRNRVVGDGVALGNIEFRWTFLRKIIANQNISLTLSGFSDFGQVIVPYEFDKSGVIAGYGLTKEQNLEMLNFSTEKLHVSYGAGLHIALNTNFIIAVDYGLAGSPQDGESGLYIALNYIF